MHGSKLGPLGTLWYNMYLRLAAQRTGVGNRERASRATPATCRERSSCPSSKIFTLLLPGSLADMLAIQGNWQRCLPGVMLGHEIKVQYGPPRRATFHQHNLNHHAVPIRAPFAFGPRGSRVFRYVYLVHPFFSPSSSAYDDTHRQTSSTLQPSEQNRCGASRC